VVRLLRFAVDRSREALPAVPSFSTAGTAARRRRSALCAGILAAALVLASCANSGAAAPAAGPSGGNPAVASATTAGGAAGSTAAATSAAAGSTSSTPSGPLAAGRALYVSNGCIACHGDQAQGNIGPKTAGTGLTFAEVLLQVRQPRGQMPPFSTQQVSDAQLQQIYNYLESLGPPTPTPAPTVVTTATTNSAGVVATPAAPVNVDAIATAVNNLKVASDYANDAAKTPADVKTYGTQALQALTAAQTAVKAPGSGSPELKSDLTQLQTLLDGIAPDVQAAASATTVAAAAPHTSKMVLASRLDLLPLAMELVRVSGEVGSVTGVVKDTAGKPVAQAFVTIEGGKVHTGLLTDANGAFKASDIAAFRSVEVKAYKAGYLYVQSNAPVTKGGSASVVITMPPESNPPASPKVSNTTVSAGPLAGTASAHFTMTATQKDNRLAPDQIWALSPEAGVAYVLRGGANTAFAFDQTLPGLKAGKYTWYFFATTHECDMSNVVQQQMTVQ